MGETRLDIKIIIHAVLLTAALSACQDFDVSETSFRRHSAIYSDPALVDRNYPAALQPVTIQSGADTMVGNVFIPQGKGPHPTAIVLHGFPGNENNYDLAHALRRAGWSVLVFHYRGSWGSTGSYSFTGGVNDVTAAIDFLFEQSSEFRADPSRLVLVGHSMGGFLAIMTAAHDVRVKAVASIAGFNFGAYSESIRNGYDAAEDAETSFATSLAPLRGTTAGALVDEFLSAGTDWDLRRLAPSLTDRPVLLVAAARDNVAPPPIHHVPLVDELVRHGADRLTVGVLDSDHAFSDRRIALTGTILNWLDPPRRTTGIINR